MREDLGLPHSFGNIRLMCFMHGSGSMYIMPHTWSICMVPYVHANPNRGFGQASMARLVPTTLWPITSSSWYSNSTNHHSRWQRGTSSKFAKKQKCMRCINFLVSCWLVAFQEWGFCTFIWQPLSSPLHVHVHIVGMCVCLGGGGILRTTYKLTRV